MCSFLTLKYLGHLIYWCCFTVQDCFETLNHHNACLYDFILLRLVASILFIMQKWVRLSAAELLYRAKGDCFTAQDRKRVMFFKWTERKSSLSVFTGRHSLFILFINLLARHKKPLMMQIIYVKCDNQFSQSWSHLIAAIIPFYDISASPSVWWISSYDGSKQLPMYPFTKHGSS